MDLGDEATEAKIKHYRIFKKGADGKLDIEDFKFDDSVGKAEPFDFPEFVPGNPVLVLFHIPTGVDPSAGLSLGQNLVVTGGSVVESSSIHFLDMTSLNLTNGDPLAVPNFDDATLSALPGYNGVVSVNRFGTVRAVPEPSAFALLALGGLSGLAVSRSRRSRRGDTSPSTKAVPSIECPQRVHKSSSRLVVAALP